VESPLAPFLAGQIFSEFNQMLARVLSLPDSLEDWDVEPHYYDSAGYKKASPCE
jgi:hypothetical protein